MRRPKIQSIPIRTTEGNSIRKAFAKCAALAAIDYAEIEKRTLTYYMGVEGMNEIDEETWKAIFNDRP